MNKTISQIAKEIGVSKQAVWQKIKREPLSTKLKESTEKIGNTLYINPDGIDLIKNSFLKANINKTSIDENKHQKNINAVSIAPSNMSIETSTNINNHQENVNKTSTFNKDNINDTSIDVNNSKINENQLSTDKIIDTLVMQLKTVNQQNENLAEELSRERKHSRELADKLAEIASNAQKLHAGDIVTPRLSSNNEVELDSNQKSKKRNGVFNWILRKNKST